MSWFLINYLEKIILAILTVYPNWHAMKIRMILVSLFIASTSLAIAQPTVGIYSFYLDKEVDFSLMQGFSDNSKEMIQTLVQDPEFNLEPLIQDFHEYFIGTAAPLLPIKLSPEETMLSSGVYQSLENHNKYEKTEMHQSATGYVQLGRSFDDSYLQLTSNQSLDGLMSVRLQFFVRKNMLKTVIQAQVTVTVWNDEGKKAWNYAEFGISKIGFTAVSGFVVSKQDEVMPMFESAMSNLKEKMSGNITSRAKNATKKL